MTSIEEIAARIEEIDSEIEPLKEETSRLIEQKLQLVRQMQELMGIPDTEEGTTKLERKDFTVRLTRKFSRKVDAEKVQQIAREHGFDWHILQSVFRWKPEINLKVWRKTSPRITELFSPAITTKPLRPTIKIEREGVEE